MDWLFWLMDWCVESDGAAGGEMITSTLFPTELDLLMYWLIDWCSDWWIDVQNPKVQPGEMITSTLFRTKLDLLMYWLIDVLIDGLMCRIRWCSRVRWSPVTCSAQNWTKWSGAATSSSHSLLFFFKIFFLLYLYTVISNIINNIHREPSEVYASF